MSNADKNWKNKAIIDAAIEVTFEFREATPVADLEVGDYIQVKNSFTRVNSIVECPGSLNRTHVHINKSNCYDSRAWVKVK